MRVKGTCSIEECNRPHKAHGLCDTHYCRAKSRTGVGVDEPIRTWAQRADKQPFVGKKHTPCDVHGCERLAHQANPHYCAMHLRRYRIHGDPLTTKQAAHIVHDPQAATNFWALVEKGEGCWVWKGRQDDKGYGRFYFSHIEMSTHRIAWELLRHTVPDNHHVCHNCPGGDNPLCCNPDHLFIGTPKAHGEDRAVKRQAASGDRNGSRTHPERLKRGAESPARLHPERMARGEQAGSARLTESQVTEIRAKYKFREVTYAMLAQEYGVSYATIERVIIRRYWKHLP